MRRNKKKSYRNLLIVVFSLLTIGLVMYFSASFGLFAKDHHLFYISLIKHIGLGAIGGVLLMFLVSHYLPISLLDKYAYVLYFLSLLVTGLVFIPGLGFSHGGASRWISFGFITFQPVEFLKVGALIALSHWLIRYGKSIREWKGFVIYFLLLVPTAIVLLLQPDTSSTVLIFLIAWVLAFLRGAKFSHLIISAFIAVFALGGLIAYRPYIRERIDVYFHPEHDPLGAGYQIRQSKVAIGSGEIIGRGIGKSGHKFGSYLPEASSDSIFAIYAEETGFVGSFLLIILYIAFLFFGIRIAKRAKHPFEQNLVVGLVLFIVIQSLLNIATISGLIPLSGFPLIFMSGGGTALLISLIEVGVILAVARRI